MGHLSDYAKDIILANQLILNIVEFGADPQLAIEARYFGLAELAATCTVDTVASLALACGAGITSAEILELPSEQLDALLQEQGVGVVYASKDQGKRAGFLKPMISGIARFFSMYIMKGGILDGKAGWNIAVISAQTNVFKYKELRRLAKG